MISVMRLKNLVKGKILGINHLFSLDFNSIRIKSYYKSEFKFDNTRKSIILIEAFQPPSNELASLHFIAEYSANRHVTPVAYYMLSTSFLKGLLIRCRYRFSPMRAAGVKEFILLNPNRKKRIEFYSIATDKLKGLNNLQDFEKLTIENVDIGDIFYDQFLRDYNYPTIKLGDTKLITLLCDFLFYFAKFTDIFRNRDVEALLISHYAYRWAIPARIGLREDLNIFQINGESAYRILDEVSIPYSDFRKYPEIFSNLPIDVQQNGLFKAKERLERRFGGEVGIDMAYSNKSAYSVTLNSNRKLLANTNKIKVLIAVHDFYDSPHSYGWNFHEDMLTWLLDLDEISKSVNYEWYIKTHPEILGDGKNILDEFVSKNSRFKLLPPEASHHQIISEGINFALTVFGTIASEYPYLGVPVINASLNNPHSGYSFSVTPKSLSEYRQILYSLDKFKFLISKDEILEYYFMHKIFQVKSLLFRNYEIYLDEVGGYAASMSTEAYRVFIESSNRRDTNELKTAFRNFIDSREQRLYPWHFKLQM
jgi:hypothetical protein